MDKIEFIGRMAADPTGRSTEEGTFVSNFTVIVNRRRGSGEDKKEQTIKFDVAAWGALGESCHQYLKKGRQVYIDAQLIPDPDTGGPEVYEKNDGSFGARFKVRANAVEFLGASGKESVSNGE